MQYTKAFISGSRQKNKLNSKFQQSNPIKFNCNFGYGSVFWYWKCLVFFLIIILKFQGNYTNKNLFYIRNKGSQKAVTARAKWVPAPVPITCRAFFSYHKRSYIYRIKTFFFVLEPETCFLVNLSISNIWMFPFKNFSWNIVSLRFLKVTFIITVK